MTRRIRYYLPAVLVFLAAIVAWEIAVRALEIRRFLLPPLTAIGEALGAGWSRLAPAGLNTFVEAIGGFGIGLFWGLVVAFGAARSRLARDMLMPFAIGANAVPIIAFAPIMNNWFGTVSPLSKMMIVAVLVFFPVMINTLRGLTSVDASALELMRSYAASDVTVLRKVRVAAALPYFFTALKVSATLSLIGAIVGEYFGGSANTLGYLIVQSASSLRFETAWAAVLIAAALGIGFYLLILALERVIMPWHVSVRGAAGG
ncbi:MAG: ABC transporter permease [Candidatus Limnocylindria bacterium]